MGGGNRFTMTRYGKSHGFIVVFACLAMLAGGCSKCRTGQIAEEEVYA